MIRCPLAELGDQIRAAKITTQALVLVGPALGGGAGRPGPRLRPRLRAPLPPARPPRPLPQEPCRDADPRPRRRRRRVPPGDRGAAAEADVVAGGRAVLDALAPAGARQVVLGADLARDARRARREPAACACSRRATRASSASSARSRARARRLDVHPAPSSVAVAFARLGLPWDDALVVSAHGRDPRPAINTALRHPKVAILTEPRAPAEMIVAALAGRRRHRRRGARHARRAPRTATPPFAEPNVVIVHEPTTAARPSGRRARRLAGRCPRTPSSTARG